MKKPDLTLLVVCDQADLVEKQFGHAVNHVVGPALPMTVEHLSIVTEWRHGCGNFNFQIKIVEPGGEAIYTSQVQEFSLKNEDECFEEVAELGNVAFRNTGTHWVEVYLGAEEVFHYPVSVNIEPVRRDRVPFFSLPKHERIARLASAQHDQILGFVQQSDQVATNLANDGIDRVRRVEDKTNYLLPVTLVLPVLLFSGIFGQSAFGNAVKVLPVFVLAVIFSVMTLWPFPLPRKTSTFIPDPRDNEGVDAFYCLEMRYQEEILRFAHNALEKKVSAMKYAYLFTSSGFFSLIILFLLQQTDLFNFLRRTSAKYASCRYLPDLLFISLTLLAPYILGRIIFKKPIDVTMEAND